MEYISVSSLISDFWNLLFFPLIRVGLIIFIMQFIFGKDKFSSLKLNFFNKILQYNKKIKYHERLGKAAPIVTVFLFFSFLYLFSIFYSTVESFIMLRVSFRSDYCLSSETIFNVWQYHPYIEDFYTLQKIVYYNAKESELGIFKLLSTEGLRHLPQMLLKSSIVFVLILLNFLIMFLIIKITKRDFWMRVFMILRAILMLLILISLSVGISFLNKNYVNDYDIQAWNQYESQVLSSGAPPESDIDIKNVKSDEVNRYINSQYYDFNISLGFGPIEISITYTHHHFEFKVLHSIIY